MRFTARSLPAPTVLLGTLAVVLAAACVLTAVPLTGQTRPGEDEKKKQEGGPARDSARESSPGGGRSDDPADTYEPASTAAAKGEAKAASPTPPVTARPLSAFEEQLKAYQDPLVKAPVLQFGYEIFDRPQLVLTDAPVGPDYVLGTGDSLVVSLWGNMIDQDHRATIDRDGEVRLPQIGLVSLKGLTLGNAEATLKQKFDQILKNYTLQLRLGRMRDMPVHVIGRVAAPGRIRVVAVATLFDALSAAGGITKEGTLRRVLLRRRGQAPRVIDLYAYLLEGDLSVDITLEANDAIVVPSVGARVAIVGRVLRAGIYELLGNEINFDALLDMAGGYARLADRASLQLETASSKGLSIRTVDLVLEGEPGVEGLERMRPNAVQLRDGEVALVRAASPRLENVVYVAGNVAQPGRYAHREGMRVADVVTEQSLMEAGFWLGRSRPESADANAPLPEPFLEYALIRRIQQPTQQETRIAFHLGKAILEKDPTENRLLQPQDTIVVFPRSAFETPETVFVSGAVQKPGELRYFPGMRVQDIIRSAGGLRLEAHLTGAMLTRVHPDQAGVRFERILVDVGKAVAGDPDSNIPIQPGDALAVRVVPEYHKPYRVEVAGEVRHPGTYTVIPGERLNDLLRRAGGFTKDAYLPAAQFYRESVRQLQQERINESLERLDLELKASTQRFTVEAAATGNEKADVAVAAEQARVEKLITTLRATPAKGRMVVRLNTPEMLQGTEDDLELADGDKLTIPRQPQEVTVIGAVFNQTSLVHSKGRTADDYLQDCGGPSSLADMSVAYIIRADGSADSARSARKGYRWDADRARYSRGNLLGSELYPGDTFVVPYDVKPQLSSLALTSTITQILFQTALATGVIVALL